MLERFSAGGREAVHNGMAEARRLGATAVGPEHLLVGLAARSPIVVGALPFPTRWIFADELRRALIADDPEAEALAALGISLRDVRETLEETFGPDALTCDGRLPFRADTKRALELALREAVELRHRTIGTPDLLLGLLREPSRASELLAGIGVDGSAVYDELRSSHAQLSELLR